MTEATKGGRRSLPGKRATPKKERSQKMKDSPGQRLEEQIARRAYELYLERGGQPGRELDDWLQAEREVAVRRSS